MTVDDISDRTGADGIDDLVDRLEREGVELWLEGERLRYRAPHGVLTQERLDGLRERREEISALLRTPREGTGVQHDPDARYEPFPLTEVQSAYLTGRGNAFPYGGVGCHGYGELRWDDLDPERLERAWTRVVRRHDMLRTVVTADGWQRVDPDLVPPPVPVLDLGMAGEDDLDTAAAEVRSQMDHHVYAPGQWPMFDLRITRAGPAAVVHFSIDFLVADFVSLQVVLRELEQAYTDPAGLGPDPEVTFRDVHAAMERLRRGPAARRDRRYWRDRIDDLPGPPELPVLSRDRARPRFRRLAGRLTPQEWGSLTGAAGDHGVSPSSAVLTAYADVVARWSRRPRFTLNVTLLDRPPLHPDVERLVGEWTSVELLVVDPPPAGSFAERAQAVQERLWEDLDHRRFSGVEVMRELRRRTGAGLTLFPVVYTSSLGLGTVTPEQPGTGTGAVRLVDGISQTPQVWLDCQVSEQAGGLAYNWDVREGVFAPGVVEAMFAAFEHVLRDLCRRERWSDTSPLPVPAAQSARRPVPQPAPDLGDGLLHTAFFDRARVDPDRPAVLTSGRTVSYGELAARASAVADRVRLWGPPGSLVAVETDKGWAEIAAVLGILSAGRVYVPVDTAQPVARRDRIIADSGAVGVLTDGGDRSAGRPGPPRCAVGSLDDPAPPVTPPPVDPDDLAYVIYTSGSTGAPKGVMVTHRAASTTLADITERFAVGGHDRVLGVAALGFDLSVFDVFGVLGAGGGLVLPDPDRRADPQHWGELMQTHQVSLWNSVPAQLEMLLAFLASAPDIDLDALRLVLLSGDWIPVTLPAKVWRRLPQARLVGLGGATEAAIWSIVHPIDEVEAGAPSIPYGRPLRGQTVEVLDTRLAPVPDLVTGEIYIGGDGLAAGYLADPRRTAERFVAHPGSGRRLYRTGDLGRYLPDGEIEFLGREDAQVKIRGHRVELAEVEAALISHPSVHAAVVVPVGTPPGPIRLGAFVEAAATRAAPGPTPDQLVSAATSRAATLRAEVDEDQMLAFARQLDLTALEQMTAALRAEGVFTGCGQPWTTEQVLSTARVAPRHHRLVRRWLRAMAAEGVLGHDASAGTWTLLGDPAGQAADRVEAAWRRVGDLMPEVESRTELIGYFRDTADNLPALMRGDIDPLRMLFPEGRTEIHEVAYNRMFLSRYVNSLLVGLAERLAGDGRGVEVLEVGAGVGGTSVELIPVLAPHAARYLFTDVSEFFLNNARRRFEDTPNVEFARFDLNEDPRPQGLLPNRFDLVVCCNVLHYARNADAAVARLRELLAPGGWLLVIEATRDSYQIMTSMEFLFDESVGGFEDARGPQEQTFLTRAQWHEILEGAGAGTVVSVPPEDRITDTMGMHVFAAQFKADRVVVPRQDLADHLAEQLPEHMLPYQVQVLDRIPLTDNGKVDRRTLTGWLEPGGGSGPVAATEGPRGPMEEQLAEAWCHLLPVEHVGRHQNFFELGGDSLLAAQLATHIRQSVPEAAAIFYDDLLRMVLETATVAALAERMAADAPAPPAGAPSGAVGATAELSTLRALGEQGRTEPDAAGDRLDGAVLVVHDASGTLDAYRPLVQALTAPDGPGRPVLGLEVGDLQQYLGLDVDTLVEDVATRHAAALSRLGRERLRVVGAGFGGVLAAELCRQLVERGVDVECLVVLHQDPDIPGQGSTEGVEVAAHSTAAAQAQPLLPYVGDITVLVPADLPPDRRDEVEQHWQDVGLARVDIVEVASAPEVGPIGAALPVLLSALGGAAAPTTAPGA